MFYTFVLSCLNCLYKFDDCDYDPSVYTIFTLPSCSNQLSQLNELPLSAMLFYILQKLY